MQDLFDLARALGVSPLTLLFPPSQASVRLGEAQSSEIVSGRRFRDWMLGRRPLSDTDSQVYFNELPDGVVQQSEEWNELQSLAAEAVWAAQDPEVGYQEAMSRRGEIVRRLDLLLEQLEINARKRDPKGHRQWEQRRQAAARRDRDARAGRELDVQDGGRDRPR